MGDRALRYMERRLSISPRKLARAVDGWIIFPKNVVNRKPGYRTLRPVLTTLPLPHVSHC